jgi:hypothetical protein
MEQRFRVGKAIRSPTARLLGEAEMVIYSRRQSVSRFYLQYLPPLVRLTLPAVGVTSRVCCRRYRMRQQKKTFLLTKSNRCFKRMFRWLGTQ